MKKLFIVQIKSVYDDFGFPSIHAFNTEESAKQFMSENDDEHVWCNLEEVEIE